MIGLTLLFCLEECIFWDFGWKAVECFKWDLMGHPSRNKEDFVSGSDLNCGTLILEVSRRRILLCGQETVLVVVW